jgi:integrase/recombinase XerD
MNPKIECARFSLLLQEFFSQRLMAQSNASSATVASYRDTFRLLLQFAQERWNKSPAELCLSDLDAPFILAFLEHLEQSRGVCARTRNVRLVIEHFKNTLR